MRGFEILDDRVFMPPGDEFVPVSRWVRAAPHARIVVRLVDHPAVVFVRLRWLDVRYGVTSLHVAHSHDARGILGYSEWSDDPDPGGSELPADVFRSIPLPAITAAAADKSVFPISMDGDPPFNRSNESTLDLIAGVSGPERGSPLSHEQLVWTARTYELAIALGRPPTKTIADRLGASLSTARVWVAQARAAGLTHVAARPGSRGGVR